MRQLHLNDALAIEKSEEKKLPKKVFGEQKKLRAGFCLRAFQFAARLRLSPLRRFVHFHGLIFPFLIGRFGFENLNAARVGRPHALCPLIETHFAKYFLRFPFLFRCHRRFYYYFSITCAKNGRR